MESSIGVEQREGVSTMEVKELPLARRNYTGLLSVGTGVTVSTMNSAIDCVQVIDWLWQQKHGQGSLHEMNRRTALQAVCCVRVPEPVRADTVGGGPLNRIIDRTTSGASPLS